MDDGPGQLVSHKTVKRRVSTNAVLGRADALKGLSSSLGGIPGIGKEGATMSNDIAVITPHLGDGEGHGVVVTLVIGDLEPTICIFFRSIWPVVPEEFVVGVAIAVFVHVTRRTCLGQPIIATPELIS